MAEESYVNQIKQLEYAPLPWQTHPIDLADGSQGWGPMHGAYMPVDFAAARVAAGGTSDINIYWTQGDNSIHQAPGYAAATVFADRATSFVNNQQYPMASIGAFQPQGIGIGTQTIAQGVPLNAPPSTGKLAALLSSVRKGMGL